MNVIGKFYASNNPIDFRLILNCSLSYSYRLLCYILNEYPVVAPVSSEGCSVGVSVTDFY